MSGKETVKDLIVLTADKDAEFALKGLFRRHQALGIGEITYDIEVHPGHDSACFREAECFLRPFLKLYEYALVVFDREGSGGDAKSREELEAVVEQKMEASGWEGRSAAVVIEPELDAWVWSGSPHVSEVLRWSSSGELRDFLVEKGFLQEGEAKPARPKEALDAALRKVSKPHSSSLFMQLAERVNIKNCTDPSFQKLKRVLRTWFPESRQSRRPPGQELPF